MKDTLAVTAGVLAVLAVIPYLLDIIHRRTKPNVVSWLTWTLLLSVGTAGAYAGHEVRSALLTTGDLIGTGATLVLGLRYGIARLSWFDGLCQLGALLGLVLWLVLDSPAVAIVAVVIIDCIGLLPTLKHSWESPSEETWQTFALLIIASALTIVSLSGFNVVNLSYPLYLLFANVAVVIAVVYRRKRLGISLSRSGNSIDRL